MPCMLMSRDSIKFTSCPYSSCDGCIEAHRANPRSDGVSNDIWRSWSCRAKLQILQLGVPAPPWDSGMWRRSRLIFDDACNLWRFGARTALCSWCIWRVVSHCGTRAKVMLGWMYWVMAVYRCWLLRGLLAILAPSALLRLMRMLYWAAGRLSGVRWTPSIWWGSDRSIWWSCWCLVIGVGWMLNVLMTSWRTPFLFNNIFRKLYFGMEKDPLMLVGCCLQVGWCL